LQRNRGAHAMDHSTASGATYMIFKNGLLAPPF
jgi:hypothetical protein